MKRTKRTRPQMTLALPLDPAASNAELEAAVRAAEASFLAKPAETLRAPAPVPAAEVAKAATPAVPQAPLLAPSEPAAKAAEFVDEPRSGRSTLYIVAAAKWGEMKARSGSKGWVAAAARCRLQGEGSGSARGRTDGRGRPRDRRRRGATDRRYRRRRLRRAGDPGPLWASTRGFRRSREGGRDVRREHKRAAWRRRRRLSGRIAASGQDAGSVGLGHGSGNRIGGDRPAVTQPERAADGWCYSRPIGRGRVRHAQLNKTDPSCAIPENVN